MDQFEKYKGDEDLNAYGFGSYDKTQTIISFSNKDITHIKLPAYVDGKPLRKIGFGAFRGLNSLVSVEMPDTVEIIENSAFRECKSLRKVILSKNTRNLAPYSFAGCSQLKSITLPSDLMNFSDRTFNKCYALTDFLIIDKNKNNGSLKKFIVACKNEHRRFGFMQASLLYFDDYSMRKYDEGYSVIQEFEDLFNIAEYRLKNPEDLPQYMKRIYENAIQMFIPKLIREDQVERLTVAGDLNLISPKKLDSYLGLAAELKGSSLAYLLEFKEKNYKREEIDFSL